MGLKSTDGLPSQHYMRLEIPDEDHANPECGCQLIRDLDTGAVALVQCNIHKGAIALFHTCARIMEVHEFNADEGRYPDDDSPISHDEDFEDWATGKIQLAFDAIPQRNGPATADEKDKAANLLAAFEGAADGASTCTISGSEASMMLALIRDDKFRSSVLSSIERRKAEMSADRLIALGNKVRLAARSLIDPECVKNVAGGWATITITQEELGTLRDVLSDYDAIVSS